MLFIQKRESLKPSSTIEVDTACIWFANDSVKMRLIEESQLKIASLFELEHEEARTTLNDAPAED